MGCAALGVTLTMRAAAVSPGLINWDSVWRVSTGVSLTESATMGLFGNTTFLRTRSCCTVCEFVYNEPLNYKVGRTALNYRIKPKSRLGVRVLSEPLLKVEQLFCERDDRVLFENLSFGVEPGEVVQIEGQNGSGKTTLLRILSGLSRNFEGEIYWNGELMGDVVDDYRRSLLYFGHQPGVKAILTPEENLNWYSAMHPSIERAHILDALERVGLQGYEDVPCHMLSAGQNRRVSLARLYLSSAPLWILDEPLTAIDKQGVKVLEALFLQQAEKGGIVILTTHQDMFADNPKLRKIKLGD